MLNHETSLSDYVSVYVFMHAVFLNVNVRYEEGFLRYMKTFLHYKLVEEKEPKKNSICSSFRCTVVRYTKVLLNSNVKPTNVL